MNTRSSPDTQSPPPGARLRFELVFGSIWLAAGLCLVPALIYWVGTALLGPYGAKAGLSAFYGAFFADLASGAVRTWILALGPLLLVTLVRVVFIGVGRTDTRDDAPDDDPPGRDRARQRPAPTEKRRVEPRIGG